MGDGNSTHNTYPPNTGDYGRAASGFAEEWYATLVNLPTQAQKVQSTTAILFQSRYSLGINSAVAFHRLPGYLGANRDVSVVKGSRPRSRSSIGTCQPGGSTSHLSSKGSYRPCSGKCS